MGLYGMTSGQALGQGTFTFDRIVPNRYLLDSRVNNDSVMPGRYALIEYDRPVAVIDDINNFIYEEGSKAYDIIPVKDGVINIVEGADCIFICMIDANDNNLYLYYYYNLSDGNITSYASPMTPNEFNKIVDRAYIAKNEADDIDSKAFDIWDSTAWIKIIDKEHSEFKYIKIADLNVLTPSFTVDEDPQNEHEPTTTFNDTSGTFNAPSITQGQNASFVIKFPPPMNINVAVETTANETGLDEVTSSFSLNKNTKEFIFKLPSIGNAVTKANNAASGAQEKIDTIDQKIIPLVKNGTWPERGAQPSYSENNYDVPSDAGVIWLAIGAAYEAAHSANAASSSALSGLINTIGTDGITVSIGNETVITGGKLNIEVTVNNNNLITASKINAIWDGTYTSS